MAGVSWGWSVSGVMWVRWGEEEVLMVLMPAFDNRALLGRRLSIQVDSMLASARRLRTAPTHAHAGMYHQCADPKGGRLQYLKSEQHRRQLAYLDAPPRVRSLFVEISSPVKTHASSDWCLRAKKPLHQRPRDI